MKRSKIIAFVAVLAVVGLAAATFLDAPGPAPSTDAASPEIGKMAPDFTLEGTDGETYTLSDLQGEYVVLEWLNFGCPYVQKHYNSGNIPALQEKYTDAGVKWLSVVSSAPGKQGHYPPAEMNAMNEEEGGQQSAILMDPSGEVGQMYGARTTPHMYIINPEGTLIYKGGIDDKPTSDEADIEGATNYVTAALDAAMSGNDVQTSSAPPYGCSVKYASE